MAIGSTGFANYANLTQIGDMLFGMDYDSTNNHLYAYSGGWKKTAQFT